MDEINNKASDSHSESNSSADGICVEPKFLMDPEYEEHINYFTEENINLIEVEGSYEGPKIESFENGIKLDWVKDTLIPYIKGNGKLIHKKYAYMVSLS